MNVQPISTMKPLSSTLRLNESPLEPTIASNWALVGLYRLISALATIWVALFDAALIIVEGIIVPVLKHMQKGGELLLELNESYKSKEK